MRKKRNTQLFLIDMRTLFVIFSLNFHVLTGCSPCSEARTRVGVNVLNANIEKWDGINVNTYVLTYSKIGGQLSPSLVNSNRVVVDSGAVSQIEVIDNNGAVVEQVEPDEFSQYFTVESLFEEIRSLNRSVKDLEVQYDEAIGIPSYISVDPNLGVDGCGDVSDDEYSISTQIEF